MFNVLEGLYTVFSNSIKDGWDGFYGNRSDYYLCQALTKFREKFPPTTDSRNHLLQRALRKSYLEATLLLCNSRLKELQPSGWRKFLTEHLETDAANPSSIGLWSEKLRERFLPESGADREEILWLCDVIAALNSERNRVDRSDEVLEISEAYELFLQPRGKTVANCVDEMRRQLESNLLAELQRIGAAQTGNVPSILPQAAEVPPHIVGMVETGWIPYDFKKNHLPLDDDQKIKWFDCFCGYFQNKLTGELADIFQNRLLVSLRVGENAPHGEPVAPSNVKTLDFQTFQNELKKLGKSVTEQLDGIEQELTALGTNQTDIKNKLDELLPLIMTAENISTVVKGLPGLIVREHELTRRKNKKQHKQTRAELKEGFKNLADKIDNRRTETGLPSNLRSVEGFVGREDELNELRDWFLTQKKKSFVLHGFGGVGKSAIADYFAKELEPRFEARIYIEMRGAGQNPMTAPEAMFEAIKLFDPNVPANLSQSDIENLFHQFVNKQSTLIVLDNAKDRTVAEPLNHAGASIIVTSRESFTLSGGRGKHIEKMLPADARKLLFSIADESRFDGQADTLAFLAGYIPMALQPLASLLAENILLEARHLVTKYADRKERLRLADPNRNNLTVEASLDLSYEALTDELKLRWRQLAVFPADFELNAAATVWRLHEDLPTATETLISLAKYSLIEVDKITKRCQLHDLARDYAYEKLTAEELLDAQYCYVWYYRYLLSQSQTIWKEKGYKAVLDEIDREWHNIVQGQKWSTDNVQINEHAPQLCIGYSNNAAEFISLRLHPQNHIDWLKTGLSAARKLNNQQEECNSLGNLGIIYHKLGEYQKAIENYNQVLEISLEIGDNHIKGQCLSGLGNAYENLGEYRKAINYHEQALKISREIDNQLSEGHDLGNLGNAYYRLDEYRKAIVYYEQALNISLEIGNRLGESKALGNLGNAYDRLSEYQKAIEYYEQQLSISREIGDRSGEGISLGNLGSTYNNLGERKKACGLWKEAIAILDGIESPHANIFRENIENFCES